MKRNTLLIALACLAAAAVWSVVQNQRGPRMAAYEVTAQPLVQTVVATGRITAVARADVGSEVTGVVRERRVQEGDAVQAGDILAVLRADDLEAALREAEASLAELQQSTRPQAQAALREAEAALAQATRDVERRRDLVTRALVAREELEKAEQEETRARAALEQARFAAHALDDGNPAEAAAIARVETARARLDKTFIRTGVSGTVLTRNAEPGDLVQPGTVLFEIAPDGDTEILVPLDERNLETLDVGQPATAIADAYPARPFPATVSFIAPAIDSARGTVDVRLTMDPVPDFLRQGMTVSVNIETGRRERALVAANDALVAVDGSNANVWVVADGRATRRNVQLGLRGLTQTEITNGLQAGDWILADARSALDAGMLEEGTRVRPVAAEPSAASTATRNEIPVNLN
ncbi:MAG: efflux RND transporter periplasmic adaptor subunit [Pseudomonadota bacterium]|nr:efflux RND transporter periplasmic adaptor subunit [Pseudomonadota bacterium]